MNPIRRYTMGGGDAGLGQEVVVVVTMDRTGGCGGGDDGLGQEVVVVVTID